MNLTNGRPEGMENKHVTYSIVVPVYNSGQWMDTLVERVRMVMEKMDAVGFELLLVDDRSPDPGTWPAIVRNAQAFSWVNGYRLLYNVGQFRATLCGLQNASGDYIITMDDDLQHPPEEIPKLIEAIQRDPDVLCVMGQYHQKSHNWFRNLGSQLFRRMMNRMCGIPANVHTTSFRIMKKELAQALLACRGAKPILSYWILSITKKIGNIDVRHEPRVTGTSGYPLAKLIRTTLDSVVNASTAPLRFFSGVGFVSAAVSLAIGLFFFVRWLVGGIGVAGFMSQILLISFFGGMMLTGIGVLGEYVARIIAELTGPESYRVQEKAK